MKHSSNKHVVLKMNYRCKNPDWMNGANDLTDEVIQMAHQVQKETKNYNRTYQTVISHFPYIAHIECSDFKNICLNCFPYLFAEEENEQLTLIETFKKSLSIEEESNALYYKSLPKTQKPRQGRWSPDEVKHFIETLQQIAETKTYIKNHSACWGYFSLHIPGRTGKQCYDKYKSLF